MDNYQLNLLNRGQIEFYSELGNEKVELKDSLVLYQSENYKLGGYKIVINNSMVSSVMYQNKKYVPDDSGMFIVPFDFNKAEKEIILSFKGGIADDCVLTISLMLSNHEAYDIKEAQANQEQLNNNIALLLTKGNSLINIYQKKANEFVIKSVIKVYYYTNDNTYLIEECETNLEFKSICGLGYGSYKCVVEQYDSKDKLIASASSGIVLRDDIESLKKSLTDSLDSVKGQVRASGRHTVIG